MAIAALRLRGFFLYSGGRFGVEWRGMDLRICLVLLLVASLWAGARDIDAAQRGVKPGQEEDCGPALRALLEEAAREPGCRVVLQPGCYEL